MKSSYFDEVNTVNFCCCAVIKYTKILKSVKPLMAKIEIRAKRLIS